MVFGECFLSDLPIRSLAGTRPEPDFSAGFSIRDMERMLPGTDRVQELHRRDF